MIKNTLIILLSIFSLFSGYSQNSNSQKNDWYFYYNGKEEIDKQELGRLNSSAINITNLVDTTITNGNKKCISLAPTARANIIPSTGMIFYIKPSILGDSIVFKNDSVFLFFEGNQLLVNAGLNNDSTFQIILNDSLELLGKLENKDIYEVNGMIDSIYTFSIKTQTKFIRNYTYGKNIGFVDIPDFYQLINYINSPVDSYSLKFSNAPKIGYTDFRYRRFDDFNIGDKFYYKTSQGNLYKEVLNIDSTFYPNYLNVEFYYYYSASYESGTYNIRVSDDNYQHGSPYSNVFIGGGPWPYELNYSDVFYINNRLCISRTSPTLTTKTLDRNKTLVWSYLLYFENTYCEGLGRVASYTHGHEFGSDWFYLIDYVKGNEVWTKTEEINADLTINIYPNPTTGILHIKSQNSIVLIDVFDISGIKKKEIKTGDFSTINLSDLSSGIYFLKIYSKNEVSYFKILIE